MARGVKAAAAKGETATKRTVAKAQAAIKDAKGLSPNPMTSLIVADIALRGGGRLLRYVVERALLGVKHSPDKAHKTLKGRGMAQTLVGTAAARVATRSVPGALLVGGGLLAKALYDRRKKRKQVPAEGEADAQEHVRKA